MLNLRQMLRLEKQELEANLECREDLILLRLFNNSVAEASALAEDSRWSLSILPDISQMAAQGGLGGWSFLYCNCQGNHSRSPPPGNTLYFSKYAFIVT